MSSMNDKIRDLAVPASSVKHRKVVVKKVSRADISKLNSRLEKILAQNKLERQRSWEEAHDKIVGN